jgi:hypothetical protein
MSTPTLPPTPTLPRVPLLNPFKGWKPERPELQIRLYPKR